jgi:uncharacterized Zn-binding protein involved in type VI secretion
MPQGPAARITDKVVHPLPGILIPGPASFNTIIGKLLAWRGIPTAAAAGLQAAKQASDLIIQAAEAATIAAAPTPGAAAAKAAEMTIKLQQLAQMSSTIMSMSGGADINVCVTPVPPHGPGVVIDGSPTVLINNLPACRLGDTIIEALGPPNKIIKGEFTVIIGNTGQGCTISGGGGGGGASAPPRQPTTGAAGSSGPPSTAPSSPASTSSSSSGGPGAGPPAGAGSSPSSSPAAAPPPAPPPGPAANAISALSNASKSGAAVIACPPDG